MRYFGIISLLIVVAIGAWWAGNNADKLGSSKSSPEIEGQGGAESILDSARTAADQLGNTAPNGPRVEVYAGISLPDDSASLDLSGRGLTGSLKAEIRLLKEIKALDLSGNKFTGVPAEVGQLNTLEILDLSNNPITGLPHEIGNLQKLKLFNLKGTNYSVQDLEIIKEQLPPTTNILTD